MRCTIYPHHRSSVTVHVGVCGGGVEQSLIFDFNSSTEYNLYVYLTYIWFICLISIMSKALGLQTLGDKLLADLAASWWFLLLGLCFSFLFTFPLLVLFSFPLCFPLSMLLFFVCAFFSLMGLAWKIPPPLICWDPSKIFPGVLLSLVVALLWVLAMRWILNFSQLLPPISSTSPKSPTNWPFHLPLTC